MAPDRKACLHALRVLAGIPEGMTLDGYAEELADSYSAPLANVKPKSIKLKKVLEGLHALWTDEMDAMPAVEIELAKVVGQHFELCMTDFVTAGDTKHLLELELLLKEAPPSYDDRLLAYVPKVFELFRSQLSKPVLKELELIDEQVEKLKQLDVVLDFMEAEQEQPAPDFEPLPELIVGDNTLAKMLDAMDKPELNGAEAAIPAPSFDMRPPSTALPLATALRNFSNE
ncbi:MAG: hypothetical protein V7708_02805 [Oceanicoccus sp.]